MRTLALAAALALAALALAAPTPAHLDHLILGVADLERASAEFERATGVRPVYGGKHPGGTHNALVGLGERTYLELVALQPGATAPAYLPDLTRFTTPTPIGWMVSSDDAAALRTQLAVAGFATGEPRAGSRATPAGATLHWETFALGEPLDAAPYFIAWAAASPHPATTSPAGCALARFRVAGPGSARLAGLVTALALPVEVAAAPAVAFEITLRCPRGEMVFRTPAAEAPPAK